MTDDLVSCVEAGGLVGVDGKTVAEWVRRGRLAARGRAWNPRAGRFVPAVSRAEAEAVAAALRAARLPAPGVAVCRHCSTWKATRPRGLCYGCHLDPAVRGLYPDRSARPGAGAGDRRRGKRPRTPTEHRPGTPGKVAAMAGRAERGELLFHPGDAR